MTCGGAPSPDPSPAEIRHALRRMRADCYRVGTSDAGPTVALIMQASVPGRRNAAARLVDLLGAEGLSVVAADPVQQLAASNEPLPIARA